MSLSEAALQEYRRLYVLLLPLLTMTLTLPVLGEHRKASASTLAVAERQTLEALTRDEKTAHRALAQARERAAELEANRERLGEEMRTWSGRREEVGFCGAISNSPSFVLLFPYCFVARGEDGFFASGTWRGPAGARQRPIREDEDRVRSPSLPPVPDPTS
jgi:hypothetical protein